MRFELQDLIDKINQHGVEFLTPDEKRAMLLDAFQFLESENFHSSISVIEDLTGLKMTDLERTYEIE